MSKKDLEKCYNIFIKLGNSSSGVLSSLRRWRGDVPMEFYTIADNILDDYDFNDKYRLNMWRTIVLVQTAFLGTNPKNMFKSKSDISFGTALKNANINSRKVNQLLTGVKSRSYTNIISLVKQLVGKGIVFNLDDVYNFIIYIDSNKNYIKNKIARAYYKV